MDWLCGMLAFKLHCLRFLILLVLRLCCLWSWFGVYDLLQLWGFVVYVWNCCFICGLQVVVTLGYSFLICLPSWFSFV